MSDNEYGDDDSVGNYDEVSIEEDFNEGDLEQEKEEEQQDIDFIEVGDHLPVSKAVQPTPAKEKITTRFLTKYEKAHFPILKIIFKLAKVFEAHLDVLQVSSSFDSTHKTIYSEWEKSFPKSEVSFFTLTSNDYEGTINEFMKLHKTNLVTMPIHHLGFFEKIFSYSLSRKLTFHSNIPILGLYERKETETKHVSKNQKTMHS